jgi:thiamine pyrophosphokinase
MVNYTLTSDGSSIHIVIFTGGSFPAPEETTGFWKNFPPAYVIAADSGLETAAKYSKFFQDAYNFIPSAILGDFDSLSDKSLLLRYPSEIIKKFPENKDYTDTELALVQAYSVASALKKKPFITLTGGDGGRIDHLLGIYDTFSSGYHADTWLCSHQVVWYLAAGEVCEISGLLENDPVSVARTSSYTGGSIHSEGLVWESDLFRKKGMPSISNKISSSYLQDKKPVILSAEGNAVLVIIPFSSSVKIFRKEN